MEAHLTVSRTSPDDIPQRQVVVKLDGQRIAELMHGDEIQRAIAPGHHRLVIDNTWNWKTLDFDAAPGEEIHFRAINRMGRFTWFLVGTLGFGPMYVHVERV